MAKRPKMRRGVCVDCGFEVQVNAANMCQRHWIQEGEENLCTHCHHTPEWTEMAECWGCDYVLHDCVMEGGYCPNCQKRVEQLHRYKGAPIRIWRDPARFGEEKEQILGTIVAISDEKFQVEADGHVSWYRIGEFTRAENP